MDPALLCVSQAGYEEPCQAWGPGVRRLCWDSSSHTACVFAMPLHRVVCVCVCVCVRAGWFLDGGILPFTVCVCARGPCGWLTSCRAAWFGNRVGGVSAAAAGADSAAQRVALLLLRLLWAAAGCVFVCNYTPLKMAACAHLS